jgi:outer membrane protein TolC
LPFPVLEGLEPEPGGLTSGETARRALEASASLKEKRAELIAADEKITQTMIQFFPRLTLLASYTRLSPASSALGGGALVGAANTGLLSTGPCPGGAPGTCVLDAAGQPVGAQGFAIRQLNDSYSVGARLSVPLSDYVLRISDASASSRSGKESARLSVAAQKLRVETDAKALYFNWLRARASAAIARRAVVQTRARLDDAKAAFGVGIISKAELLRIEALVANTELVVIRAESMVGLTSGQLQIIMEDAQGNYRVGEGVPPVQSLPEASRPVPALVQEAVARRIEVKAIDEAVRALRRGAGATRAGALPRLDAVGDVTYANPNQRFFPQQDVWNASWTVGLQASWTVGDAFMNSAAARELEAEAQAMEARRIALRAGIANEVLTSYLDHGRALAAIDKQQAALRSAEEAYRVTTDLFRAGRATGTDLIDAETELLDARIADVNALIDLTIAAIHLKHALGLDQGATPEAPAS